MRSTLLSHEQQQKMHFVKVKQEGKIAAVAANNKSNNENEHAANERGLYFHSLIVATNMLNGTKQTLQYVCCMYAHTFGYSSVADWPTGWIIRNGTQHH